MLKPSWRPKRRGARLDRKTQQLTPRLAQLIGSESVEDYHWNSGWITALLQCMVGLHAEQRLLDIGCGSGRLARGLDGWFGDGYVGVDVNAELIDYCRATWPRFRFEWIDYESDYYNPKASESAANHVFDFEAGAFDCITLFSVVTHITRDVVEQYLHEARRLLAPGGSLVFTCFLLGDDNRADPETGGQFAHEHSPGCFYRNPAVVTEAIAFEEGLMHSMIEAAGLAVVFQEAGSWQKRPGLGFQDLVIAQRREDVESLDEARS
jgi:SAM-dependent methyltransferase